MLNQATITASTTSAGVDVLGYDYLTPLLYFIFGADGLLAGISVTDAVATLGTIWTVFTVVAYILSAVFLFLYVYASMHLGELEEHEAHHIAAAEEAFARKRVGGATADRFSDMQKHIESDNPNDWKLAIIEADIILDETLKRSGYAGNSLGERLRSISPQSLRSLDDAWQAHKVRNDIAHSGVDFVLTHKLARETIVQYERVFTELGLIGGDASHHHGATHH